MGLVESFNSTRYCGVCTRNKHEMSHDTLEKINALRDKNSYENDVLKNDFRETGVKSLCVFHNLKNFHITERFCFDIMHEILEGVCTYDLCNIILALIDDNFISLEILNNRKMLFKYGKEFIGNISPPITMNRLNNYNLKMSASEMACFVNLFPLIIGDLIPERNKHWQLLTILIQFIDNIFKSKYNAENLSFLQEIVKKHHLIFLNLYGPLKPKHHFMVHYATAIKSCGPLKYMWCMRFEGKHKEAKSYLKSISSRVNPEYTMSVKSALKFAYFLLEHETSIQNDFTYNSSKIVDLRKEEFFSKIQTEENINFEETEIMLKISYKNTVIEKNNYISTKDSNLKIYKIINFLHENNCIYVLCFGVVVKNFDMHFQAYPIELVEHYSYKKYKRIYISSYICNCCK